MIFPAQSSSECHLYSLDDTSFISSGETLLQDEQGEPKDVLSDPKDVHDKFNQKMKEMFQNPTIQQLFPSEGLLTELCTILLKEVKKANPLKWVSFMNQLRQPMRSKKFQAKPDVTQDEEIITVL